MDFSLEDAQSLFKKFGLAINQPGVALLFIDGCSGCHGTGGKTPEVYILVDPVLQRGRVV